MKHTDSFSWKRLWRTSLALLLVLSMVLCGCSTAGNGDGDGTKPAENNALLGDGDGRLEAQDAVDSITNIYGALLGAFGGNRKPDTAVEMELVLTPGEKLKAQLGNALAQMDLDSDMSWLKNVGIQMETGYADDMMQMVVEAQLNGKKVISAEMVMDMVNGVIAMSVPDLNNQSIGTQVDMSQVQGSSQQAAQILQEYAEFFKDLPSDKDLNKVLTNYLNLALEELEEPTKESMELSHGGITQKVTATTYSVTRYDVLDMATAVLTAAKTDADLEKVMDALSNVANQIGAKQAAEQGFTWEDVDLYAQLLEVIDPALEDLADAKTQTEDLEFLQLTVYGDDKTQQGLKLRLNDVDYLQVISLKDGSNTAFYMSVSNMLEISGTGTVKSGKSSGEYIIAMHGTELLYVEIENFDTKALAKGDLKGTLRLQLAEDMLDQMGGNLPINEDTIIELVLDIGGKSAKMEINLYADQILLFGVALTTKTGSAGKIKVPGNYVNMQDSDAMEQWARNLKFDGVLSNLRAAGVPDKLVDLLKQAMDNAMSGGSQAYPDYGY
jgi:hypothetical protein